MKTIVILNEQHSLKPEQEQLLLGKFEAFEILPVPSEGWTLEQITDIANNLFATQNTIVFASPIPAMIAMLSRWYGMLEGVYQMGHFPVYVFHNDHREKKELPNGKVIMTVADTGWVLA